ncbi:flagellin [Oxalobacter sp. OttesenSCG-928-P03]|nr:flagellin [Oxalobacter sp. OttesenSCG-928-P03]
MAQIINTNMMSLNSQRHLNGTNRALSTAMERLASGKRINSAKDDAAGMGISARMTSQINGMNQAIRNANDGISLAQTAEGALSKSEEMLQRIRTLAVQSSNASNSPADRQSLQQEVNDLVAELDRFAQTTSFNGKNLLDGTMGTAKFQVGANAGELITFGGSNFRTQQYGNYSKDVANIAIANGLDSTNWVDTTNAGTNGITAGNIEIKGYAGKSKAMVSDGDSAETIAAAVNAQSEKTGVKATATTKAVLTTGLNANPGTVEEFSLQLVGSNKKVDDATAPTEFVDAVSITFTIDTGTEDDADNMSSSTYANAISEINKQSGKTGITAEWYQDENGKGGVLLTHSSGADIRILNDGDNDVNLDVFDENGDLTGTVATVAGGADNAAAVAGKVDLYSSYSYTVTETNVGLSLENGVLQKIADLDISTFDGAQKAIKIAEGGIDLINREMANYGALQNRLQYTIENLEVSSENTTNARSRIQDADYASETANLSRASILQQAGTAMLAQANSQPQNVLSLLG